MVVYLTRLAVRVNLFNYCYITYVTHLCEWQITERDEAALKFLNDIKSSNLDENKGFVLEFYFNTNPYFKNPMVFPYHLECQENLHLLSS